ncbi:hypothetical protein CHUAL_000517 [Chamberlinius hualienensis]
MSGNKKDNSNTPHVNIVKHGYLFIKRPPKNGFIRLKSWHKRYFVLRDETIDHPSRLEMYIKEADFLKNQTRFVLNLDKVIHVGRAEDSKRFRQAFMIVCAGRVPILLADEDAMYMNSWLLAVTLIAEKRNNDQSGDCSDCTDIFSPFDDSFVRKYDIIIESTTTSKLNGIEGDYVLTIRSWGLSLSKPRSDDYVVNWPLCFIRKFKSESLPQSYYKKRNYVVTLELGRRCSTGEGIFQFQTIYGKEIIADMNQAICRSMSSKLMPEDFSKHRCLMRSRPSFHGSSQGSYINTGWRSSTRDSVSSLNIKTSVSRQSSGGNQSGTRLSVDGNLHVDSNTYQNITDSRLLAARSPLRSDSSGDSRCLNETIPRLRTSISSITSSSSSSSHSSSASASSNHSRKGNSSGESGQYVEADFTNCGSRRTSHTSQKRCSYSANGRNSLSLVNEVTSKIESHNIDEQLSGKDGAAAKAAAEGYLEVLPDIFHSSSEADKPSENELVNIYHVMDFSKPNNSLTSTNLAAHSRHHSCSSLGVNGRSDGDSKRLRSPRSSFTECPDIEVFSSEINGFIGRKSSGGRLSISHGKPPAPLPRPEHTLSLPK